MSYEAALNKAWEGLREAGASGAISVKFLADEYSVDMAGKRVDSLSCNIPAKDFTAVLILHYLIQKIKGLPEPSGEWLTFRELSGIEGYYDAFKKRSLEPVIRKYGNNPQGLLSALDRLPGRRSEGADAAIIIDAFPGVPVLVRLWSKDEEFGSDANMFFDRSATAIFCTEDIVVLAGMVAASL